MQTNNQPNPSDSPQVMKSPTDAHAIVDLLEETLASDGSKFIAARNINSGVTK